jgi:hypothetical protein
MPERQIVHTITLKVPVRLGSEQIEELQFERMRFEHTWGLSEKAKLGDVAEIGARLAGVPLSAMKQLGIADAAEVMKYVVGELAPFQAIAGLL